MKDEKIVRIEEKEYPVLLREIENPPKQLYLLRRCIIIKRKKYCYHWLTLL